MSDRIDPVGIRRFLVPRWVELHQAWGDDPVPDPPSRVMCRYTAEFVALVEPLWRPTLGLVNGDTHVWSEGPDGFLDLTGDQFGLPEVQTGPHRPDSYVPLMWTRAARATAQRYQARARAWLDQFTGIEMKENGNADIQSAQG